VRRCRSATSSASSISCRLSEARARFNIRYNDRHSQPALKALLERRAQTAAAGGQIGAARSELSAYFRQVADTLAVRLLR